MQTIIAKAKATTLEKAVKDFDNKIKTADGFIPNYNNRPPFQLGLPWNGLVKPTLSADPRQTGIGIVMSIEIIKDTALAFVYTDINGDGMINNYYVVEI